MVAAQSKLFAGGSAEWITREALQLHGGYGYAEEYTVSRLFVDARVLSIFEGANEVLALKIIGRTLLNRAANSLAA
jgi:(2S)-methylsuccinyl-CoA dehydrogenase